MTSDVDTLDGTCCVRGGEQAYTVPIHCINCGWNGTARMSWGHDWSDRPTNPKLRCPMCGSQSLYRRAERS